MLVGGRKASVSKTYALGRASELASELSKECLEVIESGQLHDYQNDWLWRLLELLSEISDD